MIIISNSGNNIAPVDAALRAKEKGIPVIAITAVEYSNFLKQFDFHLFLKCFRKFS